MAGGMFVVGVSHHSAPLAVRERLALDEALVARRLQELMQHAQLLEGLWISTCNRVEIYARAADPIGSSGMVRQQLRQLGAPAELDEPMVYGHLGPAAVQHAFRVTASLDSMVVGEPQILGQVKRAVAMAKQQGNLGTHLGRCFSVAFRVAKRVRQETGIAAGAVSVSSIAGDLAQKIFGNLSGRRIVLLGAGKMGEAAARKLAATGAHLVVVNRSPARAEALAANYGGMALPMQALQAEMERADIVIAATGGSDYVLAVEQMQPAIRARRHRPLFLIDIAVPRAIDPRVGGLNNVFLYDLDDLKRVAAENLAARRHEATHAELIVQQEAEAFSQWLQGLALTPTIVALRRRFTQIAEQELERALARAPKAFDAEQRQVLQTLCSGLVNKLLHQPLTELKKGADELDGETLLAALQRLFALQISHENANEEKP